MKIRLLFQPMAMIFALVILFSGSSLHAQQYSFDDAWAPEGFRLAQSDAGGVEISYSLHEFTLTDFDLKGEPMKQVAIQGNFLPNNEGAPDLPGTGRFIAVPNDAEVSYTITAERIEKYQNVNIAPAPRIPKVSDTGPLHFEKNKRIYQRDAWYPASPVTLSEKASIRGVESVIVGVTPFQYNPVTKELLVYRDLKVQVSFKGGDNTFGDNRLRSRYFDPILSDMLMNFSSLPKVNYPTHSPESGTPDYEYVIICPDDDTFISWAQELALFRNQQGIRTGIFTTTDVGGNTTVAIEGFIDDAYYNWDVPPAAVLLLGDYGTDGNTIISPLYTGPNGPCISDNIYADVEGNDDMPDVILARMTAQNETHLETMITKVIDYETDPPSNPGFYDHPITALGWQTERWFQLCSEIVGGFFKNVQDKNPVRINAVYGGNPDIDPWSSNQNTPMILDYFGPDGLEYIPGTPQELGGWWGGTAADVVNAINDGSFMLQHRDHGGVTGWGEPDFSNTHINQLTNTDLCFIFSINCLTGKYNYYGECFTEKFHRHTYNGENAGALGLIAASEVSYSFVNDVYAWGMYDNMWPDFMPDYETDPMPRGLLPAFGNAAGKYFLQQSNWPYNTTNKQVTYNLFHHHGCAFSTLYSEVPADLTVVHDNVLLAGLELFNISADEGAFIALSVDGEIIGTATATGSQISIPIQSQMPPSIIDVVVTKTNYHRYHAQVQVIPPDGPYIVQNNVSINDAAGNGNGLMDYGESILISLEVKNVGSEDGENISITVNTDDPYVSMVQTQADYGSIPAGETKNLPDGFAFDVAGDIPDLHTVIFDVEATDGTDIWESTFFLKGHAPLLGLAEVVIDDAQGNGNGKLDPGETANLQISADNSGTADAYMVIGELLANDPYVTINTTTNEYGDIFSGEESMQSFSITTDIITPAGYSLELSISLAAEGGVEVEESFVLIVGRMPVLVLDLEGVPRNSGPHMKAAIEELGIGADYATAFPADLNMYSNIFVCLGIYSGNHVLTDAEGQLLVDFASSGGNLYMEGGDTWAYDEATPVHSIFKIIGVADGSGDLDVLQGQAASFTEGMEFNYGGDNNYIDHLLPSSPAFNIFKNNNPIYNAAIAYDGANFKTIGCSFEFGGLANGTGISTRVQLMQEYLNFFGLSKVSETPEAPQGDEYVCANSNASYATSQVEGADFYYWTIDPENAGTVNGTDTAITVDWSAGFSGTAMLNVCGMNNTGMGPVSDALEVMVAEAPTATITGDNLICAGDETELSVELTGTAPWELMIDGQAYTATTSPFTLTVSPTLTTLYTVSMVEDAGGCTNEGAGEAQIDIIPLPEIAATPAGDEFVNTDDNPVSTYSTAGAAYADSYDWEVTPAEAYSELATDGMNVDVTWSGEYKGETQIRVRGMNECGEGIYSGQFTVTLENSFGIDEAGRALGLAMYPNPNEGTFTLELSNEKVDKVNIRILDARGYLVYEQNDLSIHNDFSTVIDISGEAEGIYMVLIESKIGSYTGKIVVRK